MWGRGLVPQHHTQRWMPPIPIQQHKEQPFFLLLFLFCTICLYKKNTNKNNQHTAFLHIRMDCRKLLPFPLEIITYKQKRKKEKEKNSTTSWNRKIPEVNSLEMNDPQGQGRKQWFTRDRPVYSDSRLGKWPPPCHWVRLEVSYFFLGTHPHHLKELIFGVWLKTSAKDTRVALRRGAMRKVQVWVRITPSSRSGKNLQWQGNPEAVHILPLQPTNSIGLNKEWGWYLKNI